MIHERGSVAAKTGAMSTRPVGAAAKQAFGEIGRVAGKTLASKTLGRTGLACMAMPGLEPGT